jgi:myo-inositol-1(or 4)-monophosphatase
VTDERTLLDAARRAALAGGRLVRSRVGEQGETRSKTTSTDFVTDADIASGVCVVESLLCDCPNAAFVVEEEEVYERAGVPLGSLDQDEVWVIDPLDGTTSFIHGFPCYSVSVACVRAGQPVAGAVFDVPRGEMHSAAVGLGASRDDRPVHVADARTLSEALLVTGFPYDRAAVLDRQLAVLGAFLRAPVHGIRRDGSAAVDCCHVASGRADGFWEFALKPWDMAAGVVILREAGATVSDAQGAPWDAHSSSICAAPADLQARMLELIASVSASL